VVTVFADEENRYAVIDSAAELRKLKVRGIPVAPVNAIVQLNVDANKPESRVFKAELTVGKSRNGTVVDSDDKPVQGVQVAGLTSDERAQVLKGASFAVTGLSEGKRVFIFMHPEKKLGCLTVVQGGEGEPIVARLQPLGAIEGRIVDEQGMPCSSFKVKLTPEMPREKYENLPHEFNTFQGTSAIYRGLWSNLIGRDAVTDKDGRFKLDGVLPGVDFDFYVSDGDLAKPGTLIIQQRKIRVEPGKAKDIGTLKTGEGLKKG
jgi:hypothetical protein